MPTYGDLGYASRGAVIRDDTRAVFGQVMGLVALTLGCAALGAYIGRNMTGGTGIVLVFVAMGCIFGLNVAAARGHEQLAIALLFGVGLLLGLAVAPVIAYYAKSNPAAVWQAAGATGAGTAALGSIGYATKRDLSPYYRTLFLGLLALIVFGFVVILVSIPAGNIIYCVAGLVIFGGFTIVDFNRLRRANMASAVPIAAGIFLDIFNVFLFLLRIFGGGGRN